MFVEGGGGACATAQWHNGQSKPGVAVKTFFRSRDRDRDRDLDKMNSSALESRDHGLEITTLLGIGNRKACDYYGSLVESHRSLRVGSSDLQSIDQSINCISIASLQDWTAALNNVDTSM